MAIVSSSSGLRTQMLIFADNYLMTLDLTSSFSTSDGSNYHLTKIDPTVPKVKNQALWPNPSNTTLYMYGGRYVSAQPVDEGIWIYSVQNGTWSLQQGSFAPTRLVYGSMLPFTPRQNGIDGI